MSPLKILITGAQGLLGLHVQAFYKALNTPDKKVEILTLDKAGFLDDQILKKTLDQVDVIIHLASVNRGEPDFVFEENQKISDRLISFLDHSGNRPHIVFSNSMHIDRQTEYGKTKKQAAEKIKNWCDKNDAIFTNLILPHVFGEMGKPFYNSVVSTFCYQLANNEILKIDQDGELELLHGHQVSLIIHQAVLNKSNGDIRSSGHKIKVSELKKLLESYKNSYLNLKVIPQFTNQTELFLFNTFRSYLFPKKYPVYLDLKTDQRGSLIETVKTDHGGQSFLSWTKPAVTRGNHWHFYKIERFCVVQGEAVIQIRSLFGKIVHEFKVTGDKPCYIDMPTLHTHNIKNIGSEELITLFWSHEIFNPEKPDTFSEMV